MRRVQITCFSAAYWLSRRPITSLESSARKGFQRSKQPRQHMKNISHVRISANAVIRFTSEIFFCLVWLQPVLSSSTCWCSYFLHEAYEYLAVSPKIVSANNTCFTRGILEIYGCNYMVANNQQNHQTVPRGRHRVLLSWNVFQDKLAHNEVNTNRGKWNWSYLCNPQPGFQMQSESVLACVFECQDCASFTLYAAWAWIIQP